MDDKLVKVIDEIIATLKEDKIVRYGPDQDQYLNLNFVYQWIIRGYNSGSIMADIDLNRLRSLYQPTTPCEHSFRDLANKAIEDVAVNYSQQVLDYQRDLHSVFKGGQDA